MKPSEFLNKVTDVAEDLVEVTNKANELAERLEEITEYLGEAMIKLKDTLNNLERQYKKELS